MTASIPTSIPSSIPSSIPTPKVSGYSWFMKVRDRVMQFVSDTEALEYFQNSEDSETEIGLTPEDDYLLEYPS